MWGSPPRTGQSSRGSLGEQVWGDPVANTIDLRAPEPGQGWNLWVLPSKEPQPPSSADATALATPFLWTTLFSTSAFIWGHLSLSPYRAEILNCSD